MSDLHDSRVPAADTALSPRLATGDYRLPLPREYRLRLPRRWRPPPDWITRFADIRCLLEDDASTLVRGLNAATEASNTLGDLAAEEELARVKQAHAALFPGEAGDHVLWALLCDAEVQLYARNPNMPLWDFETLSAMPATAVPPFHARAIRNVFEQPTLADPTPPRYRSFRPGTGRYAFAARRPRARGTDGGPRGDETRWPKFELLADQIDGNIERGILPKRYPDVARHFKLTTAQLHRCLSQFRKQTKLPIRTAAEQNKYIEFRRGFWLALWPDKSWS